MLLSRLASSHCRGGWAASGLLTPAGTLPSACLQETFGDFRQQRNIAAAKKLVSVVLTDEVEHVGFRGEVVQVKKGFARNFLFPRHYAEYATPEALAKLGSDVQAQREVLEKARAEARIRKRLKKIVVQMKRHLMPDGTLHSPVSCENIVEKLAKQYKIEVPADQLLTEPLTSYGKHAVKAVIRGINCEIFVNIERR